MGTEDTDSHKILEVHLYRTDDHYDLLEADPTRVEAASYQTEQLQERDEEDASSSTCRLVLLLLLLLS